MQIKPLRHASLEPHAHAFIAPDKRHRVYGCADFTMVLKPFPRHLVDEHGCIDETRLLPPWLPLPPHASTHQRRHLCLPMVPLESRATQKDVVEQTRWEALHLPATWSAHAARPILRVFVLTSKKRIHKRAVLRHRTRTRLVAALRTAISRLEDVDLDVSSMLDVRKQVIMLIANADAYAKDMDALVNEMDKGIRLVTQFASAPRKHHGRRNAVDSVRAKSAFPRTTTRA